MPKITRNEAKALIENSHGKCFSCVFKKRSTGELRKMNARTEVTSHLKGGERAYSFEDKGLICVFDMTASGYRTIPINGIVSLRIDKIDYEVVDNPPPPEAT